MVHNISEMIIGLDQGPSRVADAASRGEQVPGGGTTFNDPTTGFDTQRGGASL